jgi:antitoxin (DNA-binding transcriptional repressor) of toxin-antitoxin stability system
MTYQVNYDEAKIRLPDLIDAAIKGETVLILKDDQPIVQLVPATPLKRWRQFGSARGLIEMAHDFDAPLEDFKEYAA